MRHIRLGIICCLALLLMSFAPKGAFAHGEAADEPFLKDLTVAFYDVSVSPTTIKVGEPVTITGRLTILDTWPYTLDPPQTAYITPVVPGPVFALTDRVVNGDPTFGSILVDKGRTYEYKMTMLGRTPGRWHVHPGIGIQGTGTLLGPGEWVTVEPSDKPFVLPVTLLTGQTVDLEQLGGRFVWWWSFIGFVIGLIWMIYWTVPKRTVTRPPPAPFHRSYRSTFSCRRRSPSSLIWRRSPLFRVVRSVSKTLWATCALTPSSTAARAVSEAPW